MKAIKSFKWKYNNKINSFSLGDKIDKTTVPDEVYKQMVDFNYIEQEKQIVEENKAIFLDEPKQIEIENKAIQEVEEKKDVKLSVNKKQVKRKNTKKK